MVHLSAKEAIRTVMSMFEKPPSNCHKSHLNVNFIHLFFNFKVHGDNRNRVDVSNLKQQNSDSVFNKEHNENSSLQEHALLFTTTATVTEMTPEIAFFESH